MSVSPGNKGSALARRTAARLAAVQAVYQMLLGGQDPRAVVGEYKLHRLGKPVDGQAMVQADTPLFADIVEGVSARRIDIEALIDAAMASRPAVKTRESGNFLEPLLRSIVMCGTYEILAHPETDGPVIIADYLEVTHAFYEGGESKLVNAVLDSINKTLRTAGQDERA